MINLTLNNFEHTLKPAIYDILSKEISTMNANELMFVYEIIRQIKKKEHTPKKQNNEVLFLKAQNALKNIEGNWADEVIEDREILFSGNESRN